MERPSRLPNGKARRDDILDAATRLFAERGYEGASMADLADRVGMRKASLFYHFESKDVLYGSVIERLLTVLSQAISAVMVTEGPFAERLDTLSDAVTTALGENPFAARLMVREAMDAGPVIRGSLGETLGKVLDAAEAFILSGQGEGVVAEGSVKQTLISLIGVHFMPFAIGEVVQRFSGQDPFSPEFVQARRDAVRAQVRSIVLKG